jgi:hypothetical protein
MPQNFSLDPLEVGERRHEYSEDDDYFDQADEKEIHQWPAMLSTCTLPGFTIGSTGGPLYNAPGDSIKELNILEKRPSVPEV